MTQLILAWVGGICLTGSGLWILGLFCGECVRRNRVLRDVTTEIDVRPREMRQPLSWTTPAAKGFTADFAPEINLRDGCSHGVVLPYNKNQMN